MTEIIQLYNLCVGQEKEIFYPDSAITFPKSGHAFSGHMYLHYWYG